MREELAAAYDRSGIVVSVDDALGPRGEIRESVTDRDARLAAAAGFSDPERRTYRWSLAYTTAEYIRLMGTHSTYAVLDDAAQGTLFAAVAAVIDGHGGALRLPMRTRLYMTRVDG